ncbi:MAG: zinc-dependent metalloprotease [Ahniella sp.]|nr:zinc-dependent metalloprotease [Ahniella sp.]
MALAGFAEGALPPNRQSGETERRLVPIYLLHRYQTDAVARLLGGVEYGYGVINDPGIAQRAVVAERQHAAVSALAGLLAIDVLRIPDAIEPLLVPPATEYLRSTEHFDTRMAPLFDPVEAARVATAVVSLHAFDAARLNRVYWQRAKEPAQPGLSDVFQKLLVDPWTERHDADHDAAIARARNWTMLDAAVQLAESGQLHADAQAQWRGLLGNLAERLSSTRDGASRQAGAWLTQYLSEPASVKLRALPRIPPGAPI